jgi:S-adenosylmethionine decarboxylase
MQLEKDRIRLKGFNNLTKCLSFNLYDFFVARTDEERERYAQYIDESFGAEQITETLRGIADIIDAQVISVSGQNYEPHGASSLVLMSDLGADDEREEDLLARQARSTASVGAHLTKSHLCAHTYPDWTDPKGICSLRVDIDIATCGTIVPLRALDYMFESFENDVVIIDYVVRGFTRDTEGKRVYLDHTVRSVQDFVGPEILQAYHCEDLVLQSKNIWQTKLVRTRLDPAEYFPDGVDPETPENREAFELVKREMAGIFHGWPS